MQVTIGVLARRASVSVQAIRYYEDLGLIAPASRTPAGHRRYDKVAEDQLMFIKAAQTLGFSLDEIKRALDVVRSGPAPCSPVMALARARLAKLDDTLAAVGAARARLVRFIEGCGPDACSISLQDLGALTGVESS